MPDNLRNFVTVIATLMVAVAVPAVSETADAGRIISERFKTFDRNTAWQPSGQIPLLKDPLIYYFDMLGKRFGIR